MTDTTKRIERAKLKPCPFCGDAAPDQPADGAAEQAAEQPLWRQLLSAIAAPLGDSIHVRSCA